MKTFWKWLRSLFWQSEIDLLFEEAQFKYMRYELTGDDDDLKAYEAADEKLKQAIEKQRQKKAPGENPPGATT